MADHLNSGSLLWSSHTRTLAWHTTQCLSLHYHDHPGYSQSQQQTLLAMVKARDCQVIGPLHVIAMPQAHSRWFSWSRFTYSGDSCRKCERQAWTQRLLTLAIPWLSWLNDEHVHGVCIRLYTTFPSLCMYDKFMTEPVIFSGKVRQLGFTYTKGCVCIAWKCQKEENMLCSNLESLVTTHPEPQIFSSARGAIHICTYRLCMMYIKQILYTSKEMICYCNYTW